jgi:phenylpyruvate tautomerase PptA (4-oxalocrotonate tautomerase family)
VSHAARHRKLYSGKSEQQKSILAEQITKAVMAGANCAGNPYQ